MNNSNVRRHIKLDEITEEQANEQFKIALTLNPIQFNDVVEKVETVDDLGYEIETDYVELDFNK